jgi:hypothetical protein
MKPISDAAAVVVGVPGVSGVTVVLVVGIAGVAVAVVVGVAAVAVVAAVVAAVAAIAGVAVVAVVVRVAAVAVVAVSGTRRLHRCAIAMPGSHSDTPGSASPRAWAFADTPSKFPPAVCKRLQIQESLCEQKSQTQSPQSSKLQPAPRAQCRQFRPAKRSPPPELEPWRRSA